MKKFIKIGIIATAGAGIMALATGGAAMAANPLATITSPNGATIVMNHGMMGQ